MRNERFEEAIKTILSTDRRYPPMAYETLSTALDFTVRSLRAEQHREEGSRNPQHVTGRQLAEGFRDYFLMEYGPFAKGLLEDLNIHCTADIGNMVYNLIQVGAFGKTEEDKIEDFNDVYDFEEAFVMPYRPKYI